eukprot:4552883-Prymnesium_polylepis.1
MSASNVHCWRPTDSLAPRLTTISRASPFESVMIAHCPSRMGVAIAVLVCAVRVVERWSVDWQLRVLEYSRSNRRQSG